MFSAHVPAYFPVDVLSVAALLSVLVPIAIIDSRRMIIPDRLNLLLLAGGIVLAVFSEKRSIVAVTLEVAITALAVCALREVYGRLRNVVGLGLGDVKFLAASTAWIGISQVPWLVLFACCSGLAYVVSRGVTGAAPGMNGRIAFGPHLCIGLLAVFILKPAFYLETIQ